MEGKEIKKVFFIYAQNGEKNNVKEIETNDKVKVVKEISKENLGNSIQNIYSIEILKNPEENKINIYLYDNQGEAYFSNIIFESNEFFEEENIDLQEKIIFKLKFKPYDYIKGKLDQIILPNNEQFEIFENKFRENEKLMFSLYLNTISQVFLHSNENLDFIFNFFLKIYEKINNYKSQDLKLVMKFFFKNMKDILRNCVYVEDLNIDEEKLEIFGDPEKLRTKLLFIINEQKYEENVDIFLSYYYIHYNNKLFIKFINNTKYRDKINIELISNRNLFNNFTNEILTPKLMEEAESGEELLSLMKLYPNIVECFKILTHYEIYVKFIYFKQWEKKCINIMLIQDPKKTDNIDLLKEYFKLTYDFFIEEQIYPLIIKDDFFVQYFRLFEENDEDFHKLILIIEMINLFNSKSRQKINSEKLFESYYQKGLSLLQKKKLKNLDFIKFLKSAPNLLKKKPEYLDYFVNGFEFSEKNHEFINKILNSDHYELRYYLGDLYYSIFEKIFEKFITPKDLLVLRGWEVSEETPKGMIEIFLKTIKRIWINYPENYMYGLELLFAKEFSVASIKMNNYQYYLNFIEDKIAKEKVMGIYSKILIKEFPVNSTFEKHIKDYITSYDKITPKYLWFLMTTLPDHHSKIKLLGDYLVSGGNNFFAVKYSDFVLYPVKVEETIILFTNLKNHGIIPRFFEDSLYYKNSMNAKFYIEKNSYKDALIMYSNLQKIQELLDDFFVERDNVEDFNKTIMKLIDFQDKVEISKKYFESLKKIQSYWATFFPKDKSGDLIQLKNRINDFENSKLDECLNETELNNGVIDFLPEAEEGIKLKGSIIFMELYDTLKQIKSEGIRYDKCLTKFNELKNLGNICNLNSIAKELKEVVINAIYKNTNLLNEELNFIKDYFNFDDNARNNFDIRILGNNIINEVKILQKNKGDYKIDLDEKFKLDEEENEEEENKIKKNKTEKGDNTFSVFDLDLTPQKKSEDNSKKDIEDEINKLKKEIYNLSEAYFYNSKIYLVNNKKANNFYDSFSEFYKKLFSIGIEIAKLPLKQIYEKIIPLSNKIFCLSKNSGIVDNSQGKKYQDEIILVSEFNLLIQTIELYKKFEKKNYVDIFISFNKLYKNNIENNQLNKDDINKLLDILRENIPKCNLNNIFVEIFLYEYKKNQNKELVKFILGKNFNFVYGDLAPILDLIFSQEINEKLKFFNVNEENNNILQFNSGEFLEINKACEQDENIFSEMLMFYFENKIMRELGKIKMEEKEFFGNDDIRKYFEFCLNFIEKELYEKKNWLSLLYSISFVKCYLYKLMKFSRENSELIDGDLIFNKTIKFGDAKATPCKISLQLYILKLIYQSDGNLYDFLKHDLSKLHINDNYIKEKYFDENHKNYGLDSLFIPLRKNEDDKAYEIIITKLFNLKPLEIIWEKDILDSIKNNNIDLFYCIMTNFHLSFFYDKEYFKTDVYKEMAEWYENTSKDIDTLKNDELVKNIFSYFLKIDTKNNVYKEYNKFTYDQILCLLITGRFVLGVITSEKKENLFYNIITDAKNIINNNQIFFNEYYLKDFDIEIPDKRNISCLTYKLINLLVLSHIFFSFIIKKITIEEIIEIFQINSLQNKDEKNVADYLLNKLFKEFNFIRNILIPLLGINNIIIFFNSIYKALIPKLIEIKKENDEENIKADEQMIDITVKNIISNYRKEVNDYYNFDVKKNFNDNISNENNIETQIVTDSGNNDLINALLEKPKFYNNQKIIQTNYPLLSYLTYTNFSVLNNDFRNQYIYYFYDNFNYPFISSILSEDKIFSIIEFIPKLNIFSNKVYDKINMRYNKEETNTKKIKKVFNNELKGDINTFNDFIENNNKLFDTRYKIDEDNYLSEIINTPGSKLNLIYAEIIKMYNTFLGKMKLGNFNKKNMDNVVIQESKESDYNFNYVLNEENKITIKEKLDELILLYSKRERKGSNFINVYDGGKIIYKLEVIENKLEEEFILGKKFFEEKQKLFIYSDDILSEEKNIIKKIKGKFGQKKLSEENSKKIGEYLNGLNETKILNIFYELLSLLNNLSQKEFDLKIKTEENNLDDIIKYLEIKSYNFPQLKQDKDKEQLNNILTLDTLLDFYDKVLNKAFIYLTAELKQKIIKEDFNIGEKIINEIENILSGNNIITKDILISAVKKHILRNIKNQEKFWFDFCDLMNQENIWDENVYKNEDFLNDFSGLSKIDYDEKNSVVKYCYNLIYEIKAEPEEPGEPGEIGELGEGDLLD